MTLDLDAAGRQSLAMLPAGNYRGADPDDLVPFDKYAAAARSLASSSSAARALAGGATAIERVDKLVQAVAATRGMRHPLVDETVALVEGWLARNRRQEQAA